jgi:hypothetical protein
MLDIATAINRKQVVGISLIHHYHDFIHMPIAIMTIDIRKTIKQTFFVIKSITPTGFPQ